MDIQEYRKSHISNIVAKYGVPGAGDNFDPDLNRNVAHPTSYPETLVHVIKGSLGTGLLAMPLAFKYAGVSVGFIACAVITIVCTYGVQIFFRSQYTICKTYKTGYMPYKMVMRIALLSGPLIFTKLAVCLSALVDVLLIVYQIGVCAAYIIFMAANIKDVYEVHNSGSNVAVELYMVMLGIPLLIMSSVPNMKVMAIFSLLSNLLSIAACIVMVTVMVRDLQPISNLRQTGELIEFPLTFGIVLFAISCMGIMLAVEKDMKKPEQMICWWGTLNVSMVIIYFLYAFIGFFGYWKYGENVKDSITLNLNELYKTEGQCVQILYVTAIFITYGLNAMIPVDMIWNIYLDELFVNWKFHSCGIHLTRLFVVFASLMCATLIPLFGDIISLLGAFGMSCLELMFPSMIHVCAHWPNDLGKMKWILIIDILLFIIGVAGFCAGTYSSILSIKKHLEELRG